MPLLQSPQTFIAADGTLVAEGGDLPPTLGPVAWQWMTDHLEHGGGDRAGHPYEIPAWFVPVLWRMYEYHPHTGRRLIRRVLIGVGKGNSKTEVAAAVANFEFAGPSLVADPDGPLIVVRNDPSVVMGAASFEQADLAYSAFSTMCAPIKDMFDGPYDRYTFREDGGRVERVAAKAGTNDGKRPTCVIADELHEWVGNIARNHLVLTNGLSKRQDSLEFNITTAGAYLTDSLCFRMYEYGRKVAAGEIFDPSFLFVWYEGPADVDYADADQLRAALQEANPAEFVDIDRLMKRAYEIPEYEHRRYHLNSWTVTEDQWMSPAAWNERADPDRIIGPDEEVVLMFDGSASNDSSALVAVTVSDTPHVAVIGLWEKPHPDDREWRVPRDAIDVAVRETFSAFNVQRLWFDRWGWEHQAARWQEWFGHDVVLEHKTNAIQTVVAPACSLVYELVATGNMTHDGHPGLARHVANAHVKETPNGAYIVKPGTLTNAKIDAAYSAVMGVWYAVQEHRVGDDTAAPSALWV